MKPYLMLGCLLLLACGDDGASVDPRCETLCTTSLPPVDGAFDVCSASSAETCKSECMARIADTTTVCASCLLQEADFGTQDGDVAGQTCDGQTCTIQGREGSCSYPEGDMAAEDDCLRQVFPRREVACTTEYRDPAECASSCPAN